MGRPLPRRVPVGALLLVLAILWPLLTGCASYTDRVRDAQRSVLQGEHFAAIDVINEELGVDSPGELPGRRGRNDALLLMERAALLQALGDYQSSARDLIAAEDMLEWVDLSSGTAAEVLRFFYSDDTGNYRAPPHERVILHTLNLINFLAMRDLESARVEARRLDILQRYFFDEELRKVLPGLLGLANYLSGAAFEASREYEEAARYYSRAYLYGVWPERTDARLLDILALTGYAGADLVELREVSAPLFARASGHPRPDRHTYQARHQRGDTLVVVQSGLVPYRQARRVPLNTALGYSRRSAYGTLYLSAYHYDQALYLYRRGVLSWINVPELSRRGLPGRRTVSFDRPAGGAAAPGVHVSFGDQAEAAWLVVSGAVFAAAISRAVVRALAGEATRAVTSSAARSRGAEQPAAGILGWLLSLAVQGTMAARDTPDTRGWTTLPADVHLYRTSYSPGVHTIGVSVSGVRDEQTLEIYSDGFHLLNFSRLR